MKPADIDCYWYWQRDLQGTDTRTSERSDNPLDPYFRRGKGRPKGALGLEKSAGVRTSRRDPIFAEKVEAWEKAEATITRDLPVREGQPYPQPIKSADSTAAAATVQAAILREASQLQSTPPPSTAPAAINTLKESNTSLGLRRLEAGDSYEPGTEPPRSYMRIFQRLEDVDDDAADDTATNAMVTTPRELSLVEDNRLAAAFSQFSQWSDADTPGETLHPDLEDRIYQLA